MAPGEWLRDKRALLVIVAAIALGYLAAGFVREVVSFALIVFDPDQSGFTFDVGNRTIDYGGLLVAGLAFAFGLGFLWLTLKAGRQQTRD